MSSKKHWTMAASAVALILVALSIYSSFAPGVYNICTKDDYTTQKYCTAHHIPMFLLLYLGQVLEGHNGAIIALATVAIAWFTWTLDQSTSRLWKTEERNFRTGHRAFVYIDGFNIEITTAENYTDKSEVDKLPVQYRKYPGLFNQANDNCR